MIGFGIHLVIEIIYLLYRKKMMIIIITIFLLVKGSVISKEFRLLKTFYEKFGEVIIFILLKF